MFNEKVIIFKLPNEQLLLGMQPHYKGQNVINCYNCKHQEIVNKITEFIKCSDCQKIFKNNNNTFFGTEVKESYKDCIHCKNIFDLNLNPKVCPKCKKSI